MNISDKNLLLNLYNLQVQATDIKIRNAWYKNQKKRMKPIRRMRIRHKPVLVLPAKALYRLLVKAAVNSKTYPENYAEFLKLIQS